MARDWYDTADMTFKLAAAVIAGAFTLVTYLHGENEKQGQAEAERRANAANSVLQAADHAVSNNPDEANRGYAMLSLLKKDSVYKALTISDADKGYILAIIDAASDLSQKTLATASTGTVGSTVAPKNVQQVTSSACPQLLRNTGAAVVKDASGSECWIYLGVYRGDSTKCTPGAKWTVQYLDFPSGTCPTNLWHKQYTVTEQNGAVYVRSGLPGPSGMAPVVGGLYPNQKATIDRTEPSSNDNRYVWGKISQVSG